MSDLSFQVTGAEPQRFAAVPLLNFKLRIADARPRPTPIHTVVLRCQVRIEPARRHYSPTEQERLLDLFGTPERWGQTTRPMLWTHVSVAVRAFFGACTVELPVPCSSDFSLAATKYFEALDGGEIPLRFLFSGTIFHESDAGQLQVAQVPWEKEATFRLPAATWRELTNTYYPNCAWLCLRRDVFESLSVYRRRRGLPTWEQALQRLLAEQEPVAS